VELGQASAKSKGPVTALTLEWLRRHDEVLSEHLRTYLFSDGPINESEAAGTAATPASDSVTDGSLGIGSLRGGAQ